MIKLLTNVKGIGKPSEYTSSFANFPLEKDLPIGTFVALDERKNTIVPIDQVTNLVPVGIVYLSDVTNRNFFDLTGSMDNKDVCKKGYRLDLYDEFLVAGLKLDGSEWDDATIGQLVYLDLTATPKFTVKKGTHGWRIGRIERLTDKLVRVDLRNKVGFGRCADK